MKAAICLALGMPLIAAAQVGTVSAREIRDTEGNLIHTTPLQEARSLVFDSSGRLWTIGVESDGDPERNATRQFISLARMDGVHWTPQGRVTASGYVFSPAAAADRKGGLWLAWAEFNASAREWEVRSAYYHADRGIQATERLGSGDGPELRPAIVVEADGAPLVVFEKGVQHAFQLRAAKFSGGRWQQERLTDAGSNFRPFLTVDREGRTWLAWDRFRDGNYDALLRPRQNGAWQREILFLAGADDEQRPTLRVDSRDTVWMLAGGRLAGLRGDQRVELAQPPAEPADEFLIDGADRFWLFRSLGQSPTQATRVQISVFHGDARVAQTFETPLGYRAPVFDSKDGLWISSTTALTRLASPISNLPPSAVATRTVDRVPETPGPSQAAPRRAPETIRVGSETYSLFFGEMHTHLTEHPGDRILELWPDRFYLKAISSGVLDFAAASDHDWRFMTDSKYRTIQAYASVLRADRSFLAFSGYEWSGDNYRRRRYGDRTVIFPGDYSPVFRITDPESDTPQELHAKLQTIGAIDWAHHVGAPFAVMDWSTHNEVVEPVMEMVSGHGVYETYRRQEAVPVWLTKPPIGNTSIQDALGMGKKFGLVGSSDSHNGISGYSNGMLGVYAKELTRESIMEALRDRRTFAVRGGEPLLVDLRVNDAFMGREVAAGGQPRIAVNVKARSPIRMVELVRDGKYIYTHSVTQSNDTKFDFVDTDKGKYYYVRVWLQGDKYAWSSPVWVK